MAMVKFEEIFEAIKASTPLVSGIEPARGYFEAVKWNKDICTVEGWMFLRQFPFDSINVYINGDLYTKAEMVHRPEVLEVFSWIPHADRSGFRFELQKHMIYPERSIWIELIGLTNNQPVGHLGTLFRIDVGSTMPPPHLMRRVIGYDSPALFQCSGLTSFGDFLAPILRHCRLDKLKRVLDWGCGCGRVTRHLLSMPGDVFGCDIDREAVEWCHQHLERGSFRHIDPWPPTPYEDGFFDLVFGYSVFTHLSRDAQDAWLAELKRIISPGGYLLASIHGECAASFGLRDEACRLLRNGIYDQTTDPALDGIAPNGYYRMTYQTKDYTARRWSKYFDIIDFIEMGMNNYHDLVVMRRSH